LLMILTLVSDCVTVYHYKVIISLWVCTAIREKDTSNLRICAATLIEKGMCLI